MIVCLCVGVTTAMVEDAISAGARSTKDVAATCGAGSVCGRCSHTVRTLVSARVGEPDAAPPQRIRRRWDRDAGP